MRRRLAAGLILTIAVMLPTVTPPPVAQAASTCTGWASTLIPPPTIRVLRTSGPASGSIQTVDFKTYVKVVETAEWLSSYPTEALRSGAIAVKQYGWYFAMHYRGGTGTGGCYDVQDNTFDQVYQPETRVPPASMVAAVDATWQETIAKNGSFLMTGYRSGEQVACGADADGWHMYQHSARDCALQGMSADQILHVYFDPGLTIHLPPALPAATFFSVPAGTQVTSRASATFSWLEESAPGTTIASRSLTLVMARPLGGSCAVDRWLPAAPAWQATGASPQTAAGLRTGFCYRLLVSITDSAGAVTRGQSGTLLVDPLAPVATFTSPRADGVTVAATGAGTVSWTETPATGTTIASRTLTTIASRTLTTEYAAAPSATSCTGAAWAELSRSHPVSPVTVSGMLHLYCYRYRVTLTDSAGHTGTWLSGDFLAPLTFA